MAQKVDFTSATFSVDDNRRTIRGVVVPWGQVGSHMNGKRWRFNRGSLTYGHPKFVRFNNDHRRQEGLGRAIEAEDTDEGLVMTFKVDDGPEGDRQLALAKAGRKTGLSVEVEIDPSDMENDPENDGVSLVNLSHLTAVGFVKNPAFKGSRLISVMASKNGGNMDTCEHCDAQLTPGVAHTCATPQTVTFSADQFDRLMARLEDKPGGDGPEVIDPTAGPARTEVNEPLPYRFSYEGTGKYTFRSDTEFDFSSDIIDMLKSRAEGGDYSKPLARVNDFIKATFADVETADLPGTLTSVRRPDMWVPQRDYATPLWDLTGRGAPPEGGRKFDVPKFVSGPSITVATEKVEPASGTFVDDMQTITPGQLWGKVEITRQVWRQGGNTAFSGILWSQMLRNFYEARETAIATFLATLTAATDIALTGTDASPSNDEYQATMESFEQAYADLQFVRGGNRFSAFAVHQALYRVASRVKDDMGRPMYPMIAPSNANGVTASKYRTIDVAGSIWVPAYALGAPANASTNSWLFDPEVVMAWAGSPERLFWDFGATVQTANIPQLSFVTVGLYADYAVANTDINGVRQVTFDPNTEA